MNSIRLLQDRKILVIGAGVIGLSIAYELALEGFKVTVIERSEEVREASWAAGGILSPLYPWRYPAAVTRLAVWSQRYYSKFLPLLGRQTGIDNEWTQSGLLILDAAESGAEWARDFNIPYEQASDAEISNLSSTLAVSQATVLLPEVAHVRSPRLLRSLRKAVADAGGVVRTGIEATGFNVTQDGLDGIQTNAGEFKTSLCVVAAGPWTRTLLAQLGINLTIEPVRGQMIAIARPNLLRRIVLRNGVYAIPRRDGLVVIGSTLEHVGFDRSTTAAAARTLLAEASGFLPMLAGADIKFHWSGLRPSSPDDTPYIGEHPEIKGLYVNAGHYRNGIVMAPASARLMADLILGRDPTFDPTPYRLPENA